MNSDDCSTCDFVHMDTRKLNSRRWMCVKFPNLYKGRIGDFDEPYNRCTNIFMGYCELHTPRREGKVPE